MPDLRPGLMMPDNGNIYWSKRPNDSELALDSYCRMMFVYRITGTPARTSAAYVRRYGGDLRNGQQFFDAGHQQLAAIVSASSA